ncbi:hypothetical protein C7N83_03200 [Neisseria iguanae]|uniref:Uncharacterized protein n=1 Tax=Neisseria iguanae TaxID=90242 RepID=A0A2P7U217_9NEIS|nr:hypothetical protein C7N83_03200 [Neisseria iguanae]
MVIIGILSDILASCFVIDLGGLACCITFSFRVTASSGNGLFADLVMLYNGLPFFTVVDAIEPFWRHWVGYVIGIEKVWF